MQLSAQVLHHCAELLTTLVLLEAQSLAQPAQV